MNENETNIIIVEDEALIAHDLSMCLTKMGYTVSGIAHSADAAIEIIKKNPPALALLDVNIKGAIDGTMLASILKDQYSIPFIFITSYSDDETLRKIKKLKPAGFIIKPYDYKQLQANIKLALSEVKSSVALETKWDTEPTTFYIKKNSDLVRIEVNEIRFVQAFDNYCYVILQDGKYLIPHTLKSVEEKLTPYNFLRIHRSYLVNLKHIKVISDDTVIIADFEVPISRNSKQELMDKISLL